MSNAIDQRVVEMKFENEQFEKGISTSLNSLDSLKKGLDTTSAVKSLKNLSDAGKGLDLGHIGDQIDYIASKFNVLGVISQTFKQKFANMLLGIPEQLAKTIEQFSAFEMAGEGFKKFGDKTNSVATLVSQGYKLEEVNEQIERLNWFSDETSYSLTDMTSNIAKFTASGQNLEDSADAMQGIALWAALSGQNAGVASRAMYQLSQALGSGIMRKEDYKSIQNMSMDTMEFRQHALDAGVALGTLKKNADGTYKSLIKDVKNGDFSITQFADHLTEDAWFTTDVMMKVYREYGAAVDQIYEYTEEHGVTASEAMKALGKNVDEFGMKAFKAGQEARTWGDVVEATKDAVSSGWMQTWENIFGDYEEAKELWTDLANELYDVFAESGNVRNEILSQWKELGGREDLLEAFWNMFHGLTGMINLVKSAFRDIFPQVTAERLAEITKNLKEFTERMQLSHINTIRLKNTFRGLFAAVDIVWRLLKAIGKGISTLIGGFSGFGDSILITTQRFGSYIQRLDDFIKKNNIFENAIVGFARRVKDAAKAIWSGFVDLISTLGIFKESFSESLNFSPIELFGKIASSVFNRVTKIVNYVKEAFSGFKISFSDLFASISKINLTGGLQKTFEVVKTILGGIVSGIGHLMAGVINAIGNADFEGVIDLVNAFGLGGLSFGIKNFIDSFTAPLKEFSGIKEKIFGLFDGLKDVLSAYQTQLKANTLLKIAISIGILAASLTVLASLDSKRLSVAVGAMASLFGELVGTMSLISGMDSGALGKSKVTTSLLKIAVAILILTGAMVKLSTLKWDDIAKGLVAISGLSAIVVGLAYSMSKVSKKMTKGMASMIMLAFAIKILAGVCKDISSLEWGDLAKGGVALAAISALLVGFMAMQKATGGMSLKSSMGLVLVGAALKIVASAVKDLGSIDIQQLSMGVMALGALILELGVFCKVVSGSKNMVGSGMAVVLLSVSLEILADVLMKISSLSWGDLAKGLLAISVAMGAMAISLLIMSGTKGAAFSVVLMTVALEGLVHVFKGIASLEWGDIGKIFVVLIGIFTTLGLAALLLKPLTGTILKLSGAVALFGLGLTLVGTGLLMTGLGLSALAVGITSIIGSVSVSVPMLITAIGAVISGVIGLIPTLIKSLKKMILAVCDLIIESAPAIGKAITAVLLSSFASLNDSLPDFISTGLELLNSILDAVDKNIGPITEKLIDILINIINALANKVPALSGAIMNLLGAFAVAIKDAIGDLSPKKILAFFAGVAVIALIFELLASVADDAKKAAITILLMIVLVAGITAAFVAMGDLDTESVLTSALSISSVMLALAGVMAILKDVPISGALKAIANMDLMVANLAVVLTALGALYQIPGLKTLINDGAVFLSDIGAAIGGFVGSIIGGLLEGISSGLPGIGKNLSEFAMNAMPFFLLLGAIPPGTLDAVGSLATAMLKFTAAELLDGLARFFGGGTDLAGFGEQLAAFSPYLMQFAKDTEGLDEGSVTTAANAASMIAEFAKEIPNEGGLLAKLMGENDMKTFGENLVSFGPNLKQFAEDVAGLDSDAVKNAADAASMIVSFAKEIPNEGGLLAKLMGDNDLETFGENIVKFGPNLKQFADDVSGLDSGAVENASSAASMIVAFAKEVPNEGGLISWIVGDNKIDTFGEDLAAFGKGLKGYSDYVSLINKPRIDESITAAESLIELGDKAPGADTTWNLNALGGRLGGGEGYGTSFGESLSAFSAWVEGCNWTKVSYAISAITDIVDECERLGPEGAEAMKSFGEGLTSISQFTVEGFVEAIDGATETITKCGEDMMTNFITGLKGTTTSSTDSSAYVAVSDIMTSVTDYLKGDDVSSSFSSSGKSLISKLNEGFSAGKDLLTVTLGAIFTKIKVAIRDSYDSFVSVGKTLGQKIVDGFKTKFSDYKEAGEFAVRGLISGLKAGRIRVYDEGKILGENVDSGIRFGLQEKSPSKLTEEAGQYAGQGVVNGLASYAERVFGAGANIGDSAVEGVRSAIAAVAEAIDDNVDTSPVIRPVIDDSEIQNGVQGIAAMFNSNSSFALRGATALAGSFTVRNAMVDSDGNPIGTTYKFEQNNYSPKALSRLEVYRQTKNQFAMFANAKGAVPVR